tara:strand:- start:236 stop:376 length:141 start_codon:yes stop_codon:yes gene_type:complete
MYKIVRFYFDKPNRVLKTNMTLKQAKKHCNNKKTQGFGWFDGFVKY